MANTLIHESRRLQFPLETLVDAVIELEDKQGRWPSKATVVGASINNPGDGQPGFVLSIHRPESGQVIERRYSWPSVAAAIVNYCVKMRVPMPRNSSKSIQVLEDRVVLVLENTVILKSRHGELSTLPAGSVQPPTSPGAAGTEAPASESGTEHPEPPPAPAASPPDNA
ncbi:MAG TPA: hypothetical protein VND24_10735 [Steroidobacteraceae bacterium]|nr:hypothetical protein [Steroidobacteraceae bacterium]